MDIEQLKSELRSLGFTEEKLNQLMDLAAQEVLDIALEDLDSTADDATLEQMAQMMESSSEDATKKLNMIFEKAYGPNAENKKMELLTAYLNSVIEDTQKAKDLYARYQAGDPAAVAQIKAQEGNPDVQAIVDQMQ